MRELIRHDEKVKNTQFAWALLLNFRSMNHVLLALANASEFISEPLKSESEPLLRGPLSGSLARRWYSFHENGFPATRPLPHFEEEVLADVSGVWKVIANPLAACLLEKPGAPEELGRAIDTIGMAGLLLLLGQRLTPASVRNAQAIPPSTEQLLQAASEDFNHQINQAARALAKHRGRSEDTFWGPQEGSQAMQNEDAIRRLKEVLAENTWWNVFVHFDHGEVFEARLASGHGARWTSDGSRFIGFLEPFGQIV